MFDFETIAGTLVLGYLIKQHVLVSAAAIMDHQPAIKNDGRGQAMRLLHGACVGVETVLAAAVLLGNRCDASIAHTEIHSYFVVFHK